MQLVELFLIGTLTAGTLWVLYWLHPAIVPPMAPQTVTVLSLVAAFSALQRRG